MILEKEKQAPVVNIGFDSSRKASISDNSLAHVINTLSTSLYSDIYGSIVREYTSNAYDAGLDAGLTPVVQVIYDRDNNTIGFKDNGTGMNPDTMYNVFNSWGESTRRNNANALGYFGYGSKSFLAYTNSFYIETIVDKVKYLYLYSKADEFSIPDLDLISEVETIENNGTYVFAHLKGTSDLYNFTSAIKKQLRYFTNVFFVGFNEGLKLMYNVPLYKGKHFITYNGLLSYQRLVLGKVSYDLRGVSTLPYNLYFDVSEGIEVVPSRESIKYTDKVVALISEKQKLAKLEIEELTQKQIDSFQGDFKKELMYFIKLKYCDVVCINESEFFIPYNFYSSKAIRLQYKWSYDFGELSKVLDVEFKSRIHTTQEIYFPNNPRISSHKYTTVNSDYNIHLSKFDESWGNETKDLYNKIKAIAIPIKYKPVRKSISNVQECQYLAKVEYDKLTWSQSEPFANSSKNKKQILFFNKTNQPNIHLIRLINNSFKISIIKVKKGFTTTDKKVIAFDAYINTRNFKRKMYKHIINENTEHTEKRFLVSKVHKTQTWYFDYAIQHLLNKHVVEFKKTGITDFINKKQSSLLDEFSKITTEKQKLQTMLKLKKYDKIKTSR